MFGLPRGRIDLLDMRKYHGMIVVTMESPLVGTEEGDDNVRSSVLLAFGSNSKMMLGQGTADGFVHRIPTEVSFFHNIPIESVVCGTYHNAVVTKAGLLLMWGDCWPDGDFFESGDSCIVAEPTEVVFGSYRACCYNPSFKNISTRIDLRHTYPNTFPVEVKK